MAPVALGMCERRGAGHGQLPHVGGYARLDHSWGGCIRLGVDAGLRLGMVARAQNRAGAVRRDLGGDLRVANALRARAGCGRGGGTIDLFGGALNMVVKVDMSAEAIINDLLAPQPDARRAELAAALGNIFLGIEDSARRGAGPSKTLPQLWATAQQCNEAAKQERANVNDLAKSTFATKEGVSALRDLVRADFDGALSILADTPHAIGSLRGLQAPQWVFDWVLPWRFVRASAYRCRDQLTAALCTSLKAANADTTATNKASAYEQEHAETIDKFHTYEIWRSALSPLAEGVTSEMLFSHAHEMALRIAGVDLHHCKDPAFQLLMGEQLGRKARMEALDAARPQDGIWGKQALLHFTQASQCFEENKAAYEHKFAESNTDPEVLPFADQGMEWARGAMADMIATAEIIRADDDMRHEAQQDTKDSGTLLSQVNAFWIEHVEAHKRRGGGGDGGAEAAINAWSRKTAEKAGDTRSCWGRSSGYVMEES